MRAIISDIHSNLEALRAVLRAIDGAKADEAVCLGDVVGYGPDPKATLDAVMKLDWCILGNHDEGVLYPEKTSRFSSRAGEALRWTTRELHDRTDGANGNRMDFLASLELARVEGDILYVHGSPRDPTGEYLTPMLGSDPEQVAELFLTFPHIVFVGHTHWPGVITEKGWQSPADLGNEYVIGPEKAVINVGSIGQPRDHNARASFCLFDGEVVSWRRVRYELEITQSKIYANPELDDELGDRLGDGR
jgi:predicted phosphodiesterase